MISREEFIHKIKVSVWTSFAVSLLFVIFALILLFKTEDIISNFILTLGFMGMIFGCICFLKFFRSDKVSRSYQDDLFEGILFGLFGFIAIMKHMIFADMLTYFVGFYLIYKNARRFQMCFHLKEDSSIKFWNSVAFLSAIGILFALIIIFNPFVGRIAFTKVIAYSLIGSEIIHIFQSVFILIGLKKNHEE